ncbi:MAG TPA: hypothetical protein C5S37_00130, partial [Methanophagales archaeon]|nr:hypothetical protein [Methanophagales archaeon]
MKKGEKGLLGDIRVMAVILCVFAALVVIYVYPPPPVTAKINADISESAVSSFLKKELGAEVNCRGEGIYEIRPGVSKERLSEVLMGINGSIAKKTNGEPFFSGAGINGNQRYGLDLVGGSSLRLKLEGALVRIDAPVNVNETEVVEFLEKELDTEVSYYKTGDEGVYEYEIRKSVTKEQLLEVLRGINGSIAKKTNGVSCFCGPGIKQTQRYRRYLVGGSSLRLKLEGALVRIDAPVNVNETEVVEFLEKELDTEVSYYKTGDEGVYEYEIRKSVTKEQLLEVLRGIN